jgi:type I restriction enzyme S subunit
MKTLDDFMKNETTEVVGDKKDIQGPYNLPEGWKWVKLGDERLFHIETGSTPRTDIPEYWDGNIKWVTPKDLGKVASKFIFDTERKITKEGLMSCSTKIVPKGAIIVSTRAPIGHIAIAGDDMCFNQGCKAIIIKDTTKVLPDFIYYALLTKVEEMNALGSGATFKEISRKKNGFHADSSSYY